MQVDGRTVANPTKLVYSQLSQEDVALINETFHFQKTLGNQFWTGWSELKIPIIYITKDYEYAVNFQKKLTGFESVSSHHFPDKNVQSRKRTFDPKAEASFDIEGINAVVMGSPANIGKSSSQWVITAAHEMFHVYQTSRGSMQKVKTLKLGSETDASWQLNFPFPYKDEDVMRLIHLQGYSIYLGITSQDDEDAKYNAGTALDAILVYRNFLKTLGGERNYQYSKFQEWSEGIARYTEYKMAEAAANSKYQPTAAFRQSKDFKSYKQLWDENYKSQLFPIKHSGRAVRSRTLFYYLGLGKGLLLDRLMPDWKTYYFGEEVWLDDLLIKVQNQQK
jgi:hypothetical protein